MTTNPYAHLEIVVETHRVTQSPGKPAIKLVEVDMGTRVHDASHIHSAAGFSWQGKFKAQVHRDTISREEFERVLSAAGVCSVIPICV